MPQRIRLAAPGRACFSMMRRDSLQPRRTPELLPADFRLFASHLPAVPCRFRPSVYGTEGMIAPGTVPRRAPCKEIKNAERNPAPRGLRQRGIRPRRPLGCRHGHRLSGRPTRGRQSALGSGVGSADRTGQHRTRAAERPAGRSTSPPGPARGIGELFQHVAVTSTWCSN